MFCFAFAFTQHKMYLQILMANDYKGTLCLFNIDEIFEYI